MAHVHVLSEVIDDNVDVIVGIYSDDHKHLAEAEAERLTKQFADDPDHDYMYWVQTFTLR